MTTVKLECGYYDCKYGKDSNIYKRLFKLKSQRGCLGEIFQLRFNYLIFYQQDTMLCKTKRNTALLLSPLEPLKHSLFNKNLLKSVQD